MIWRLFGHRVVRDRLEVSYVDLVGKEGVGKWIGSNAVVGGHRCLRSMRIYFFGRKWNMLPMQSYFQHAVGMYTACRPAHTFARRQIAIKLEVVSRSKASHVTYFGSIFFRRFLFRMLCSTILYSLTLFNEIVESQ
jgi:hypothetical protein